jgi:ribosomal protein S18 acetylase RimI-like enzyme
MTTQLRDGYVLRPAAREDLHVIADLVIACDVEVSGYSEFTLDDMRSLSRLPRVELEKDSWVIRKEGEPVAAAFLWDSKPNAVFYSFGVVRGPHQGQGLGSALMDLVEVRARERAVPGAILRTFIDLNQPQAARLAEARGFRFVRRQWSMHVELDAPPDPAVLPEGISVRWGTDAAVDLPILHRLITETFAGHWGFTPRTYDEFSRMVLEREDCDPTMWLIATEDDEPVAALMGQLAGDKGWVGDLGVREAWRKRGLGEALLRIAFAMYYDRGYKQVGLAVDTGNETGAVKLYERVGMKAERGDDEYEKPLGDITVT